MKVGVPREVLPDERRVAATPETVERLQKLGFEVLIERGAGAEAELHDAAFEAAGATLVDGPDALWAAADIVIKVRAPDIDPATGTHEADRLREGGVLVSLVQPAQNPELLERLAARKATVLALDQVPRISRAQKMDVLSSMANIAGYRAIIEAAALFGRFFTGQITAAGRTSPARVMVIGAGVAGLAAIAAARGLGAEVYAFDVRPAVKEQIESLGARWLELDFGDADAETAGGYAKEMCPEFIAAEMKLFAEQAAITDIIVTTALIPGKRAPTLITRAMVESMKPGSVVVDLAAEQGGNCECTEPGTVADVGGVKIVGFTDLTSRLATQASQMFGTNICHLLDDMGGGEFHVDLEDEAVRGALVLHQGELTWPPPPPAKPVSPPKPKPEPEAKQPPAPAPKAAPPAKSEKGHVGHKRPGASNWVMLGGAAALTVVGVGAPVEFIQHFTVFVLACFIGWQVVWNVTPALHTPLMSVTNAISGIIIVGGILQASRGETNLAAILGVVAILVASINIAGGFLVTQRMLQMFRK